MDGVYCISKNWKFGSFSKKRKENSSLPFLPEEIIFNILIWLPADILYNVMRYVCRGWYNIIKNPDFIQENLLQSTAGLFIQRVVYPCSAVFTEVVGECGIRTRKLRFEFPEVVFASCNGLILFAHTEKDKVFCIANPVTKRQVTLPPLPGNYHIYRFGFVYVPSLRRYKVVDTSYSGNYTYCDGNYNHYVVVLTVGVDKVWRFIDTKHISRVAQSLFNKAPISVGKFVFWVEVSAPHVLALDLESEIISQLRAPRGIVRGKIDYRAMGSKLCLMHMVAALQWRIWVLDMKLRKWIKLFNLDLTGQRCMFEEAFRELSRDYFFPSYWLKNNEVVVFLFRYQSKACVVVHSIKTGECRSFEWVGKDFRNQVHVNSLVSW